jgi:hypothetical protein
MPMEPMVLRSGPERGWWDGLRIAANGSATIRTRWCSVSAAAHTAQSHFNGTDANGKAWSITGPVVRLLAK